MSTEFYFKSDAKTPEAIKNTQFAYTADDESSRNCTIIVYETNRYHYKMIGMINGNRAGRDIMSRIGYDEIPIIGRETKYKMILAPPDVNELYELFVGDMEKSSSVCLTYHNNLTDAMMQFSKSLINDPPHAYIKKHCTNVNEEYYIALTAKTHLVKS